MSKNIYFNDCAYCERLFDQFEIISASSLSFFFSDVWFVYFDKSLSESPVRGNSVLKKLTVKRLVIVQVLLLFVRFLPRDALHRAACAFVWCPSLCPSVCPTCVCRFHVLYWTFSNFSLSGRALILVFLY